MCKGIVFDIKEFSINDGPGIRTTVFLKGCPLKCAWCHNPEGISLERQYNHLSKRVVGEIYSVDRLISKIMKNKDIYELSGGGVTFSGGEPTFQSNFLIECLWGLQGINTLLDTSGFCEEILFQRIIANVNHVYFDLKLADENEHIKWTGVSNRIILNNLEKLNECNKEYTIRIPMIPEITDRMENLNGLVEIIKNRCVGTKEIHIIPFNKLVHGKYLSYDIPFRLNNWYRNNLMDNILIFSKIISNLGYTVKNYVCDGGELWQNI